MAQFIIDIGAVPDDGQGDPLRTAFDYTNENFNQIFAAGPVLSNIQIGNNTITTTVLNSNLILSPSGIGRVQLNNTLFPRLDDVYSVGTPSLRFNSVYIGTGGIDTTGGITTTGNVTASYFIGNGSQLTGIVATAGGKIENGNSNINIPSAGSNIFVTVNSTSDVVTFANTGVYVAGTVSATGNISGTYLLGNGAFITGLPAGYSNADVANYLPTYSGNLPNLTGLVSTTGNVAGNYFVGNGSLLTGVSASDVSASALTGNTLSSNVLFSSLTSVGNLANLNVTGNAAIGNVLTSGVVSAAGNISGNYILGNGALLTGVITSVANINNGTSNVTVVSSGGNVSVGVGGTANVAVFATSGEYITGLLSASGNITGGNLFTGGLISSTGNISGNYFIGNGSQLTGVAASSVDANALVGNTLSSNVLYSSLTQVGTLANLTVTGNTVGGNLVTGGLITATGNVTGGNVSITGGTLAFANATIQQVNPLALAITGDYQIAIKPAGGSYQWTFGNDGGLTGPTGLGTTGYVSATGNITGGNVLTGGLISATGNIIGSNLSTAGVITASGNILGNNAFATGFASITGNVIAGNVNTSAIQPTSGALTITTASGNLNLQPTGNIVLANTFINSLAYPEQDTDAATKLYVDNMVSTALAFHASVYAATTTDLATATSGTITYAQPNGASNGIGAYLSTTGSFNLIDTANVQTAGTRILVKNEGNAVYNGVYTWSNATAIVRSTDADQYGPNSAEQLSLNDYFFTTNGNVNAGSAFVVNEPTGTITFGTSNISFALFSQATTYTANTNAGLSLIGAQFNAKVDNNTTAFDVSGNIIVKASANLTTPNIGVATGTSLSTTGNVNSGNVNTGGLVSATGNVTGGNVLTGGVISATGNVLTAGLVSATANVTAGNLITGGQISATGNIQSGNVLTGGLISATSSITSASNITGGNINTSGLVSATGNVTGGNILTIGEVSATGNVTGNYILGNGSQLTGVAASSVNANALIGNTLSSNVLYSSLTQVGTLANLSVAGNITGGNILSNNYYYANGTPVPPGIIYTANTAPPVSPAPKVTDQWYDTANDVLYEYLYDGTSNYWIDTTSPAFAGGVVANVAISGTLLPIANVSYDVGNSTAYFRNTYTQNLYTNNRLPAYNMPLGAVVQTVMSSSLGGSITNSTSYADVTYANVTITPSSATSKILIIATGTSGFTSVVGQDISADTQLVRSPSTSLQIQTVGATGVGATGAVSYSYMDSPGTTSPVTYKLQQKVSNASSTLTSTNIWLIAQEIAAS